MKAVWNTEGTDVATDENSGLQENEWNLWNFFLWVANRVMTSMTMYMYQLLELK